MTDTVAKRGRPRKSLFVQKAPMARIEEADEALETLGAVASAPPAPPRPVRPAVREESPRERAARRAAEIRQHNGGSEDEGVDEFFIDPATIPDGWSYEWKTKTILGKEDPAYDVSLRRKGWEPVEASRHPEMMPRGSTEKEITRKGMILMERPLELTKEARDIERRRARQQVQAKQEQLAAAKPGEFERTNKDASLVKISRGYEPMPVPE